MNFTAVFNCKDFLLINTEFNIKNSAELTRTLTRTNNTIYAEKTASFTPMCHYQPALRDILSWKNMTKMGFNGLWQHFLLRSDETVLKIPNVFVVWSTFTQMANWGRNKRNSLGSHMGVMVLLLLKSAEASWWNQNWVMKYAELVGVTFHPTDIKLHQLQTHVLDQVALGLNILIHHKFIL